MSRGDNPHDDHAHHARNCDDDHGATQGLLTVTPWQLEDFYQLGPIIGVGHNNVHVRAAVHRVTSQRVAVKVIDKSVVKLLGLWDYLVREMQVLSNVNHPNIIHLIEIFVSPRLVCIVMERAMGGDLLAYIKRMRSNGYVEAIHVKSLLIAS